VDARHEHDNKRNSRDGDADSDIMGCVAQTNQGEPGDSDGGDGGIQDRGQEENGDGATGLQQEGSDGLALEGKGGKEKEENQATDENQGNTNEGGDTQEERPAVRLDINVNQEPLASVKKETVVKKEPGRSQQGQTSRRTGCRRMQARSTATGGCGCASAKRSSLCRSEVAGASDDDAEGSDWSPASAPEPSDQYYASVEEEIFQAGRVAAFPGASIGEIIIVLIYTVNC
jgi:hypothetical protein